MNMPKSYMMYHKALLFSDQEMATQILSVAATNPKRVKALGRKVRNFDEAVWRENRERIVREGTYCKFTCAIPPADGSLRLGSNLKVAPKESPLLAEMAVGSRPGAATLKDILLATGDREIVEASPMDKIWGIGFGAQKAAEVGRERWGLNLLGKALMEVRKTLREEAKNEGGGKTE